MKTDTSERQSVESFEIAKEIEIAAPIDIAFAAMLDEIGPENQMLGGKPFPMRIEPWPGGRWFRDLGNNAGHLWGHVQVIKPPTLLEICGPLMMSYPALSALLDAVELMAPELFKCFYPVMHRFQLLRFEVVHALFALLDH